MDLGVTYLGVFEIEEDLVVRHSFGVGVGYEVYSYVLAPVRLRNSCRDRFGLVKDVGRVRVYDKGASGFLAGPVYGDEPVYVLG